MLQQLVTFFQSAGTGDLIFTGSLALVWLLLLIYFVQFLLRLSFYKPPAPRGNEESISVVMVERNEEENLAKNLPGWLSIHYPSYELLVVDDFSGDNSVPTLGLLKHQYPRLKMTGLNQETRYSQKLSRNLAMKAVSHERVVFAVPSMEMPPPGWLAEINTAFENHKDVVIGYTGLVPANGLFHQLYRLESFFQQIQSMAFCLNGLPYVVSEENIAFVKNEYFGMNGFAGMMQEDFLNMELIFNKIIRRRKNAIFPVESHVLRKDIRVERQDYYELLLKLSRLKKSLGFFHRLFIALFTLLKLLFLPMLITGVFLYPPLWPVLAAMALLHTLVWMVAMKRLQNRLKEPKIFLSSCIYGLLVPFFRVAARGRYGLLRR